MAGSEIKQSGARAVQAEWTGRRHSGNPDRRRCCRIGATGVVFALVLASCGNRPATKDDIDSAAQRIERANYLNDSDAIQRIAELEREIAYLKSENAARAAAIAKLYEIGSSEHKWTDENLTILFKNDEALRATLNQTRAAQGWAPMGKSE